MRDLLREVLDANKRIPAAGLATLTWGNVSGVDRGAGVYVIKPSGVPYDELTVDQLRDRRDAGVAEHAPRSSRIVSP